MLITFLDNGQLYDGSTFNKRPLGASEKSLILLAETLANIGHVVRIFNNCKKSKVVNKVSWNPIKNIEANHSDIWISLNDPKLFNLCDMNNKKILWLINSGLQLAKPESYKAAIRHSPTIIYQGESHINSIPDGVKSLDAKMIPLGVYKKYFEIEDLSSSVTPKAFVTTNPLMGLDWLIDLWVNFICTKLPWAELHIFSFTMYNGMNGKDIDEKYLSILDKIKMNSKYNIHVKKPKIDDDFIKDIKDMRVHLYPSHQFESSALTLQESQVMGIPAVIRPLGAAPERIYNGKTGFIGLDENIFSEYTIRLLSDMSYFKRISNQAKQMHSNCKWDNIVKEFIKVFEIGNSK